VVYRTQSLVCTGELAVMNSCSVFAAAADQAQLVML
jgi:hypothetical protein